VRRACSVSRTPGCVRDQNRHARPQRLHEGIDRYLGMVAGLTSRTDTKVWMCSEAAWRILSGMDTRRCYGRVEVFLMVERPLITVIDDDESLRESLPDLLSELGFAARAFSSAQEFLASDALQATRCLVLDIAMRSMSGPDLQRELKLQRRHIPIVFITAHADASVRPYLMQKGAVECLFKPFSEAALLAALTTALRES
jgi:CheY-like chemotaxis protein